MPESSDKKVFTCECGREFDSSRGLAAHKRYCDYKPEEPVKEEVKEEIVETKPSEPTLKCPRCGKVMLMTRNAGMSKEFRCEHCGKVVAKF